MPAYLNSLGGINQPPLTLGIGDQTTVLLAEAVTALELSQRVGKQNPDVAGMTIRATIQFDKDPGQFAADLAFSDIDAAAQFVDQLGAGTAAYAAGVLTYTIEWPWKAKFVALLIKTAPNTGAVCTCTMTASGGGDS